MLPVFVVCVLLGGAVFQQGDAFVDSTSHNAEFAEPFSRADPPVAPAVFPVEQPYRCLVFCTTLGKRDDGSKFLARRQVIHGVPFTYNIRTLRGGINDVDYDKTTVSETFPSQVAEVVKNLKKYRKDFTTVKSLTKEKSSQQSAPPALISSIQEGAVSPGGRSDSYATSGTAASSYNVRRHFPFRSAASFSKIWKATMPENEVYKRKMYNVYDDRSYHSPSARGMNEHQEAPHELNDRDVLEKRMSPRLSVISSLDVLRKQLQLQMARKHNSDNRFQASANENFLEKLGR